MHDNRRLLLAVIEELAENAHIWFEGDLRAFRLLRMPGASLEETAALKRNTRYAAGEEQYSTSELRNSDTDRPVTIRLIDTEEAEAFTLPGGHLYISRGLLLRIESEGELASVLARGIAHTALRSATKLVTREDISHLSMIPVTLPGMGGALNNGVYLVELKAIREAELDADYFGVQYLFKSGYDTKCFLDFVRRIGDTSKAVPQTFSEDPPLVQRLQALQKEIGENMPKRDRAVISTNEFQEFKNRLKDLKSEGATPQIPNEDN